MTCRNRSQPYAIRLDDVRMAGRLQALRLRGQTVSSECCSSITRCICLCHYPAGPARPPAALYHPARDAAQLPLPIPRQNARKPTVRDRHATGPARPLAALYHPARATTSAEACVVRRPADLEVGLDYVSSVYPATRLHGLAACAHSTSTCTKAEAGRSAGRGRRGDHPATRLRSLLEHTERRVV